MSPDEIKVIANQAAVICALLLPFIRAGIRKYSCVIPAFKRENILHDLSNGFTLPYFLVLIITPFMDSIIVEPQIMVIAGIYGAYMIFDDLVDHGEAK